VGRGIFLEIWQQSEMVEGRSKYNLHQLENKKKFCVNTQKPTGTYLCQCSAPYPGRQASCRSARSANVELMNARQLASRAFVAEFAAL